MPDRVVLFVRDPHDNCVSLQTKDYRDMSGAIDDKFRVLEDVFRMRDQFDAVIAYEVFIARDAAVSKR